MLQSVGNVQWTEYLLICPEYCVKRDLWVSETLKFICPLSRETWTSEGTFCFFAGGGDGFQAEVGLVGEGEDQ